MANSPKTIGIDASRANRARKTGVEWYSFRLIQELKGTIPSDCRVVLYSDEPLRGELGELPENWNGQVLKWPPRRLWTLLRLSWEMYRNPPDLLFVPSHVLPLVLPKSSVITVHDVGFTAFPEAYGRKDRLFQGLMTARAAKTASDILTVSEFSKAEIARHFPEASGRVTVTPLAFDPYRFPVQERGEVLSAVGRNRLRPPYFLFVGRLESKKNIDGLIRAFRIFHEQHAGQVGARQLALVGPPGRGYEAAKAGLSGSLATDFIREVGYADDVDLPLLYAGAEALVFPSRYEGFGLPVLEAFASRIPVILSRTASLPEVAGEAAEYFDPDSPEDLARAMRLIAESRERRDFLVQAGEDRLRGFSWKKTARMTWEVLSSRLNP
ncbi:glycosyltransferase family 4 protein [Candidatus Uhrbacteria bacterium]|nr:glycosyltransferase family 4 protein [Candidatus Uhrbacteria bacterium]